jgi:hypothetical protein
MRGSGCTDTRREAALAEHGDATRVARIRTPGAAATSSNGRKRTVSSPAIESQTPAATECDAAPYDLALQAKSIDFPTNLDTLLTVVC